MFTQLMIQLLFIFFPGMVAVILVKAAIFRDKELSTNEWIAYSFVLGILSYLPFVLIGNFTMFDFLISNKDIHIAVKEVFTAFVVAIIYSALLIFLITREGYHFILRTFKLSNKIGKEYLIEAIFASKDTLLNSLDNQWVNVRYQTKEQSFSGRIIGMNITKENSIELILAEVSVYYENNETPSYNLKNMYICTKPEEIIIEYL